MMNRWRREAMAAAAALVLMFGAAGAYSASVFVQHAPAAQAEETPEAFVSAWATVSMTAATHDGPGLRYAMTGTISAGHAVEVVRMQDGWYKCLTYLSAEPVWIFGEYLDMED